MTVYSPILSKHFSKIGFDDKFFESYETEANDVMQNVDKMCEMLYAVCASKSKIVIYTDFDVDGIMSSVIAYAGLSELGFNVSLFKPTPTDGYGFRVKDVDNIIAEFPTVSVILTGDVGINCTDAIEHARSKNIITLVTDHHVGEVTCPADIAVNPNQIGETYSHNNICGSYVLYKIIEEYTKRYCSAATQADIYRLRVFAGIATISDVMPLIYENRQLVRDSVAIMRYFYGYELKNDSIAPPVYADNYSRAFVGLKKLLEYFHGIRKIKTASDINEQFYGFYLVPFLNSCKRMGGNMQGIYDIFFSERVSPVQGCENMSCVETGIKYAAILNERRKTVTAESMQALLAEKAAGETVNSAYMNCEVYIADIGVGICGLLANKFMNISGMPTLVLVKQEDGSFSGSGRNPGWMNFTQALVRYNVPVVCRGHKEAFGVYIPNEAALDAYVQFYNSVIIEEFKSAVAKAKTAADTHIVMTNLSGVESDFYVDTKLICEYLDEKNRFHPYGHGFPEPVFKFIADVNSLNGCMFGRDNQHYKFISSNGIEFLLFNLALEVERLKYNNREKKYAWVFTGSFKYDDYETEYDTVCFYADSIDIMELEKHEEQTENADSCILGAYSLLGVAHRNATYI